MSNSVQLGMVSGQSSRWRKAGVTTGALVESFVRVEAVAFGVGLTVLNGGGQHSNDRHHAMSHDQECGSDRQSLDIGAPESMRTFTLGYGCLGFSVPVGIWIMSRNWPSMLVCGWLPLIWKLLWRQHQEVDLVEVEFVVFDCTVLNRPVFHLACVLMMAGGFAGSNNVGVAPSTVM